MNKHHIILPTALLIPALMFGATTTASADTVSHDRPVTSSRSFPKLNRVHKDLLAESTSTDVEITSDWGGLGTMSVPKTKSTAEKKADADAAKAKADADAAAARAAEQLRQAQASSTVSRSTVRSDISQNQSDATATTTSTESDPTPVPTISSDQSQRGAQIAAWSVQFVGRPYVYGGTSPTNGWDCSAFVQYVYAHFGISVPRTSGQQATIGTKIDPSNMQPGDIVANAQHAAIYIGNGMIMNAASPRKGTIISTLSGFPGAYTVVRAY
jgi:cell wall-associated NlpC family hydrolase